MALTKLSSELVRMGSNRSLEDNFGGLVILRSVSDVTNFEPTSGTKTVCLVRDEPTAPLATAMYNYDPNDTTTLDNGYSVLVTPSGARWKADLSSGLNIAIHRNIKRDGSNFGSILNQVIVSEVKNMVAASSASAGCRLIKVPSHFHPLQFGSLVVDADEDILLSSLFTIRFGGDTEIHHSRPSGVAVRVDNYPFYVDYGLNGWNLGLSVHQHKGGIYCDGGEVAVLGSGTLNTSRGLMVGNTEGNTVNSGILNIRGYTVDVVRVQNFRYGLDITMKSTYLVNFTNCSFQYNYFGIGSLIADVSNGGEGIRFVKCVIGNNISHGVNWGCISAGVVWDSCHFDYNGGSSIHFTYYGRGNRFIFTNQCWFEAWGAGRYMVESDSSGAWAANLNNHLFFEAGTYVLPRKDNPIEELPPRPIFYNRGNVVEYIYDNGMYIDFKGRAGSKSQSLVDLGSIEKIVYKRSAAVAHPEPRLGSYKQTLNFGLYNFSGTVGANVKGAKDPGTQLTVSTISGDASLNIVYGDVDTSDASTYTHAQDINVTASADGAAFILQNLNLKIPMNNPEDTIYAGINLSPTSFSGDYFVRLRVQVYLASDLTTPIGVFYGPDVKLNDLVSTGGDGSGFMSVLCKASIPASVYSGAGGSLVAVPGIAFVGYSASYKIRLPAFWK